MPRQIKTALLSVSDKTGLVDFARFLHERGVALVSTGGTAQALTDAGLPVRAVSDVTGFPEVLRGRVKTLHPHIHASLLADTRRDDDAQQLAALGLAPIDMLVVNLYPFERVAGERWRPSADEFEEVIETIDVGGPCMIRAAAKNHANIAVVTAPMQYDELAQQLQAAGAIDDATRRRLALAAFRHTAAYDAAIATWLEHQQPAEADEPFPEALVRRFDRRASLRYGENPHQAAAFYAEMAPPERVTLAGATQIHGGEISYNNLLDCEAALQLAGEFAEPACVVVKHTNPCGVAIADDIDTAFERARDADPTSAFGGILAVNRPVTLAFLSAVRAKGQFFECLVAPRVEPDARESLIGATAWVARLRVLEVGTGRPRDDGAVDPGRPRPSWVARGLEGGLVVQSPDTLVFDPEAVAANAEAPWSVATPQAPDPARYADLRLAWTVCKHVKSNAIVLAKDGVAIGIGAGQMSRVESTQLAIHRAQATGGTDATVGSVLASDAFFPFPDSIDLAANAGVKAIIQPGGSKRDSDVIGACAKYKIPMVFTRVRHFRH